MDSILYGLRAAYAGTLEDGRPRYLGGILAVDGRDFDVAATLDAGGGVISVDPTNAPLIGALDAYPPLKRLAGDTPAGVDTVGQYDDRTVAELRVELERRGLATAGVKAELIDRLTASDHAAAGITTTTGQEA